MKFRQRFAGGYEAVVNWEEIPAWRKDVPVGLSCPGRGLNHRYRGGELATGVEGKEVGSESPKICHKPGRNPGIWSPENPLAEVMHRLNPSSEARPCKYRTGV
jgi:hypothetical protein